MSRHPQLVTQAAEGRLPPNTRDNLHWQRNIEILWRISLSPLIFVEIFWIGRLYSTLPATECDAEAKYQKNVHVLRFLYRDYICIYCRQ